MDVELLEYELTALKKRLNALIELSQKQEESNRRQISSLIARVDRLESINRRLRAVLDAGGSPQE